jgi:hypothetical protein
MKEIIRINERLAEFFDQRRIIEKKLAILKIEKNSKANQEY